MPTLKAHKTRHHSNLRPKHKHSKKFLQTYWPYLPLMTILITIVAVLQPWQASFMGSKVLPYATNVSITGLLNETNEQRDQYNREELELNSELNRAAQAKAKDMVTKNYWSHNTPEGDAPWVFVAEAGYNYEKAGENLAYGFLSSKQVVSGWMNSASHKANLLDKSYVEVGFGFADSPNFQHNGPSTVIVAMYGDPVGGESTVASATADTASPGSEQQSSQSYSSLSSVANSANSRTISKIQFFTNGVAPWLQYVIGMIAGASVMYLVVKHALGLRRLFKRGENYAIKHPLLDTTLISLIVLIVLVIQKVGVVL